MTAAKGTKSTNKLSHEFDFKNVMVEFEEGIAWVTLNRPDKRNAMSPALNREMLQVLDALEVDKRCRVLVLTGAGESFSSGMDLKEYFRETDNATPIEVMRVRRDSMGWQWRRLMFFPKPTIAMVNGWCFGGAFTPAGFLRHRHRRRGGGLRPVGDQLGHHSGRQCHARGQPKR